MSYLDKSAQKSRLRSVVHMAGPRYDTRVNITLPISFTFDVLGRTDELNKKLLSLGTHIWEESRFIGREQPRQEAPTEYPDLIDTLKSLAQHLKTIRTAPVGQSVRWSLLLAKSKKSEALAEDITNKLYKAQEEKTPPVPEDQRSDVKTEINELFRLQSKLRDLNRFISSAAIASLSNNSVLINGQAGSGKTHLLCDVATNRLNAGLPTYIFLGEEFDSGDPLKRIRQLLKAQPATKNMFEKINDQAKSQNVKAIIMIDAINESSGKVNWEKLKELRRYKNIAVVISIRSGFEKSVLKSQYGNSIVAIEHEGFGELDWQAVGNFFKLFNIPLPKVPIIAPEFRNPLFLKLFCETYKRSRVFSGHLGTTKLFEAYNKKQGLEVLAALSLPANNTRVWRTVIKPAAQWMADNGQDRILEARILSIIEQEFPGRSQEVLKLLQRHWLLTKVPHYTRIGTIRGHEYRFPYQKFSDHLIVRCLLTTHLTSHRDSKTNPEKYFKPNTKLGKIVCTSWNYGLIEALSVQVPERLDGTDLVWVIPEEFRDRDTLAKGFMQSVVWRNLEIKDGKHKYFDPKGALDYANKYILPDRGFFPEFLNVLLSVSGLPDHPLNATVLDKYLRQFTMADRDVNWQEFLIYNYEDLSMIKRLIDWAWYQESKQYLSDDAMQLVAIPLIWFLAASNRTIRDRSTKALIELLKSREDTLVKLLESFKDVNDPYIRQRLYAVAYGCALRCTTNQDLKKIASFVYEEVFKDGKPPVDVLLRDHARSIIELYHKQHSKVFDPKKFRPPYNSEWPERVPTLKSLQKRYRDDEDVRKDHYSVWSSVMYDQGAGGIADFGNYVVNSNLRRFTGYRINASRSPSEKELLRTFEGMLSAKEKLLWQAVSDTRFTRIRLMSFLNPKGKDITPVDDEKAQAVANAAINAFKINVLVKKKYKPYERVVLKSINGDRLKDFDRFDTARGQRWIVNRVMKLGWSPAKHGEYDRLTTQSFSASRDRSNNERIGKKYQWIALHELLARVSDNFLMGDDFEHEHPDKYQGPWQLSIRDIDPSHTIQGVRGAKPSSEYWWTPENYDRWNQIPRTNDWLKNASDLPDFTKMLQVKDATGITWLNLKGYYTWEEPLVDVEESRRYDIRHKQVWVHVYGYVIDKNKRTQFYQWAKQQDFWNKWMPESHESYRLYYGEFPDSAAFRSIDTPYYGRQDWIEPPATPLEKRCPVRLLVANDEYAQEGNSNDRSSEEGFSIELPAKYLYEGMNLKTGLNNAEYVIRDTNEVAFKDPSVESGGPGMLLANKKLLLKYLDDNNLTIVWTVMGEKMLIGGHRDDFKGRLRINGAYTVPRANPTGSYNIIIEGPGFTG